MNANATQLMLMEPNTGAVDTLENWREDFERMTPEEWGSENFEDGLIEVVENIEGQPGYDESYGQWRPAEE